MKHVVAIAAVGLILTANPGAAQTAAASATTPMPDTANIWSIVGENASISSAALTDRYYTNGLRLGWTSGEGALPSALSSLDHAVWGDGRQRISFSLSQQIYTPYATQALPTPIHDQPFAGILLGNAALLTDTDSARSLVGVALGVVGPWALGREVQNGFHSFIGQSHNRGWGDQLRNEPAAEIISARVWRLPIAQIGDIETDALPAVEAGLGNLRVYAQAGAQFRVGQGLDADYGVRRIRPGATGDDTFQPVRPFGWYVFAGATAEGVAHDITLDGNTYQSSPNAALRSLVGDAELGFAVIAYGTRITYTQTVETQRFQHQKGGPHQFGALSLAARF